MPYGLDPRRLIECFHKKRPLPTMKNEVRALSEYMLSLDNSRGDGENRRRLVNVAAA